MARVTVVKKAQQRYATKPVLDEHGNQKVVPVLRRDGTPKLTKHGRAITRRVTEADKTRPLPNLKCEKCGKEIEVGTSYKWIKPKSGPYGGRQRNRCIECPYWRPSETTGSAALSEIYGAREAAGDAISAWDGEDIEELRSILNECAEGVRNGAEVWREGAQNIEDGFGHSTYQSDELNEKADAVEGSADELENVDFDDFDEDEVRAEVEGDLLREYLAELDADESLDYATAVVEVENFDDAEYTGRVDQAVEEKKDEWADEQRDIASNAVDEIEIP